jgi:hypothetical protein
MLDAGCKVYHVAEMLEASNVANAEYTLNNACFEAGVTLTEEQRQVFRNQLAFLDNPEYHNLGWQSLVDIQNDVSQRYSEDQRVAELNQALEEQRYYELLTEFQTEVDNLGLATNRLEVAKMGGISLLDLSTLDTLASGRESQIGLIKFSDRATLVQPMGTDFETLNTSIEGLQPFGGTNIGDGLQVAMEELRENAAPNQPLMIILLSDGIDGYLSADTLLTLFPPLANEINASICTIGFGNTEMEVDTRMMSGLAEATGGRYLFATSGEELAAFFIGCRQGLVSRAVDEVTGVVREGETIDASIFHVNTGATELSVALTFNEGRVAMGLVDPDGNVVDITYEGANIQTGENVDLVTINNPEPGEWMLRITGEEAPEGGAPFSLIYSSDQIFPTPTPTATATLTPTVTPNATRTPTPTPTPTSGSTGVIVGGIVVLIVVAVIVAGVVWLMRQRS